MLDSPTPARSSARAGTLRHLGGAALGLIALVLAVLAVLAVLDLGHLVFLRAHLGNPFVTGFAVLLCVLVAVWLGLPVRSEADDRGRARLRVILVVLTVVSLIAALFARGHWYVFEPTVVAHDPHSSRVIAKVRQAEPSDSRSLHVHLFSGTGLGARDLGDFGSPCGDAVARFEGTGAILVTSVYGDFHLRFDPRTGAPIDRIGEDCSPG